MTGEITLTGRVLPIGGLREKTMAAYSAGVHTVLIPKANVGDLDEIDPEARAALEFIPVSNVKEVLGNALVRPMPAVEPAKPVLGASIPASATPAVVITTINEHPMQGVNADGA